MQSVRTSEYTIHKQPTIGYFDYVYYFYFKDVSPLERSLLGTRKS